MSIAEAPSLNTRYDVMPYHSLPYPGCHPDALAVVAQLAGRAVGSPKDWRILDLGCGEAGNLLSIAASLPDATCVGVDGNARALERGRALIAETELDVELIHADLTDLPDLGTFDAIFVHGVWSWCGPAVRQALPEALGRLLSPDGLLYVSYLASPGAHMLQAARDIARRWAARSDDPASEVAAVRASIPTLLAATDAADTPYRTMLALEAQRWDSRPDYLLFHDVLDPDASTHTLEDLRQALAPSGLTWLGEVRAETWWRWRSSPASATALEELAQGNPADAQQYHDDATGPVFKSTVFARAEHGPPLMVEPEAALQLFAATPPTVQRPELPPGDGATLLEALTPEPLRIADAAAAVGLAPGAAAAAALHLAAAGAVLITYDPPAWTVEPGPLPRASSLPRVQARATPNVTSLRHSAVGLQHDAVRALLLLLDGTRDREQLALGLAQATTDPEGSLPEMQQLLEPSLELLGRMGLLLPAGAGN